MSASRRDDSPLRTFLASPSPTRSEVKNPFKLPPEPPSGSEGASTLTTLPTTVPSLASLRESLQEKGYCIIPQFLPTSTLNRLRQAAQSVTLRARGGQWPSVRTLPRQFPPWPVDEGREKGIWGVQHLLHPSMPEEERKEFLELYFDEQLLEVCLGLMRGENGRRKEEGEPLVMELFNMLVRPDHEFGLRWHRDSVPFDGVSIEKEAEMLGVNNAGRRTAHHVQYNIPLFRDQSLIVIPGSHLRPRTSIELERLQDPYVNDLPDMLIVDAQPGDVVFYDNNIIHTGRYDSGVERITLHGCVGDVKGGNARARNILQHGIGEWVGKCEFEGLGEQRRRAESMKRNLLKLGSEAGEQERRGIFDE